MEEEIIVSPDAKSTGTDTPTTAESSSDHTVKTPERELYAAMVEERKARKDAERKVKELTETMEKVQAEMRERPSSSDTAYSEEGMAIRKELMSQIEKLENNLKERTEKDELSTLLVTTPQLSRHMDEFDDYRRSFPGINPSRLAKLFLVEKGLVGASPSPEGLEPARGTGQSSKSEAKPMTAEEVGRIRKNDPKLYLKMLQEGKLKL